MNPESYLILQIPVIWLLTHNVLGLLLGSGSRTGNKQNKPKPPNLPTTFKLGTSSQIAMCKGNVLRIMSPALGEGGGFDLRNKERQG